VGSPARFLGVPFGRARAWWGEFNGQRACAKWVLEDERTVASRQGSDVSCSRRLDSRLRVGAPPGVELTRARSVRSDDGGRTTSRVLRAATSSTRSRPRARPFELVRFAPRSSRTWANGSTSSSHDPDRRARRGPCRGVAEPLRPPLGPSVGWRYAREDLQRVAPARRTSGRPGDWPKR